MLKTAIKNVEIEKGRSLTDEEIQSIIVSSIKKGKEAAEEFKKGNRKDLVEKEEEGVRILYGYLPEQLSREEIEDHIKQIIAELKAEGPRDIGKVMKAAMQKMSGKVQGKEVSEIAKKLLG
jgi:uncharacterized protein YqeY